MLCRLWVAFSAMQSARWSGKRKFISAGASVPGVSWKTMRTPSSVSSSPVRAMSRVGGISVIEPVEVVRPRPAVTWPSGALSSSAPYMYEARRAIAGPA